MNFFKLKIFISFTLRTIENYEFEKYCLGGWESTTATHTPHRTTSHPSTPPEATRGGRHRARVSMPRMPFVRGLRAVDACVWFPRAVLVHGGLRKQSGCQWTPLCGWRCACTREVLGCCRGAVFVRV